MPSRDQRGPVEQILIAVWNMNNMFFEFFNMSLALDLGKEARG
jgi:hypothetical protein